MHDLGSKLRESGQALASVFSNPGLRRVQLAFVGSIVGDWAYAIAVAVYAYDQGGPAAVGLLGVVRYLSMALVLPLASTLADRYPRKWVMLVSDVLRAALVLVAAGRHRRRRARAGRLRARDRDCARRHVLPPCAGRAASRAWRAIPGELTAANVASSTIESVGFFLGPALGGLLLAVADIQTVYLVNAATFIWSAAFIVGLRAPPVTRAEEAAGRARVVSRQRERRLPRHPRQPRPAARHRRLLRADRRRRASLVFVVTLALDLLDLGRSRSRLPRRGHGNRRPRRRLRCSRARPARPARARLRSRCSALVGAPALDRGLAQCRSSRGGDAADRPRELPRRHQRLHDPPADGPRRGHGACLRRDGERGHRRHGRRRAADAGAHRDVGNPRCAGRPRRRRHLASCWWRCPASAGSTSPPSRRRASSSYAGSRSSRPYPSRSSSDWPGR